MNWYFKVLKNYATFSGRARRKEYWMFCLYHFLISFILGFVGGFIGTALPGNVYAIAVLVPALAVSWRRMHDLGKSGWYALIPIYNLVLACKEGERTANEFGPDPKSENESTPEILHS